MSAILGGNESADRLLGALPAALFTSATTDDNADSAGGAVMADDNNVDAENAASPSILSDPSGLLAGAPILGSDTLIPSADGLPISPDNGLALTGLLPHGVLDGNDILGGTAGGDILGGAAGSSDVSLLDVAGQGTTAQPIFDAVNGLIKDVHFDLEALSHQTGTADIIHGITGLAETVGLGEIGAAPAPDGPSNLITDTLNLPGDILNGDLNGGIANIGSDLDGRCSWRDRSSRCRGLRYRSAQPVAGTHHATRQRPPEYTARDSQRR